MVVLFFSHFVVYYVTQSTPKSKFNSDETFSLLRDPFEAFRYHRFVYLKSKAGTYGQITQKS